jgi:UDP-N-acetylmuramyl tripeptide synthase
MDSSLISAGKFISFISRTITQGNGSTWPGHFALKLNNNFIHDVVKKNSTKVIFIAGTNGKTTTSTLLRFLLDKNNIRVFQNESGANLLNGVASSIIQHANLSGKLPYDVALFETDENTLPLLAKQISPDAIIFLNLFRDQLDRYGEVNTIASKWQTALNKLPKTTNLFVNGDDPELSYIAQQSGLNTHYFGLEEKYMSKKEMTHDVDFLYCPNCHHKLTFKKTSYSHMGDFVCSHCGYKKADFKPIADLSIPLLGTYNLYNTQAAATVIRDIFGIQINVIQENLKSFKPAFGRQEILSYRNKNVMILLSKNPAGFNQSLNAIIETKQKLNVLLVLNDRIPDGRDVSWIWDVDFENLIPQAETITISGDRVYDMGLRIKYAQEQMIEERKLKIEEDLTEALDTAIQILPENKTLYVLCTYSAMLEMRKIITGKKIL